MKLVQSIVLKGEVEQKKDENDKKVKSGNNRISRRFTLHRFVLLKNCDKLVFPSQSLLNALSFTPHL